MSNLLDESRKVKNTADKLLKESGLLDFLKSKGEVIFTGSYQADVMLAPDIDVHIKVNELSQKFAVQTLTELIYQDFFRFFSFRNFVSNPKEGFPEGYYIGLKIEFEGYEWKVDVWLVAEMDENQMELIEHVHELDEESKEKILEMKQDKIDGKTEMTSLEIYKKILGELN